MKNRTILVKGTEVTISKVHDQDYISLTDMVAKFEGGSALIEQSVFVKEVVRYFQAANRKLFDF